MNLFIFLKKKWHIFIDCIQSVFLGYFCSCKKEGKEGGGREKQEQEEKEEGNIKKNFLIKSISPENPSDLSI